MKISDVRIRLVNKEDNKLKAVASITIDDCFVIHDIKVIEATDGALLRCPAEKPMMANIRILHIRLIPRPEKI